MTSLVDQLCELLDCYPYNLEVYMFKHISLVDKYLKNRCIVTKHLKVNRVIHYNGLSKKSLQNIKAFNGYMGITLLQYYYVKHRIRLIHQKLPCIMVKGGKDHISYYPLEVLEIL